MNYVCESGVSTLKVLLMHVCGLFSITVLHSFIACKIGYLTLNSLHVLSISKESMDKCMLTTTIVLVLSKQIPSYLLIRSLGQFLLFVDRNTMPNLQ
jgi:hypothetical protein